MKYGVRIIDELNQCSFSIALVAVSSLHDNSNFRSLVLWVEIAKINDSNKLLQSVRDDKPDLLVCIYVACRG